jgi:DNA-binding MarR family transcriptional regulator
MKDRIELFDTLVRAQIELWNAVDSRVRSDCGVPLGRIEILRVIDGRGGAARVLDIAEDLVITIGAASKLADRVEQSGHVERRANPDDRRSSLVELTTAGRSLLSAGLAAIDAELTQRLTPLTLARRTELLGALRDLRRANRS